MRRLLLVLVLLPTVGWGQRPQDQYEPRLSIFGPDALAANFVYRHPDFTYAPEPPYAIPDPDSSFVMGVSVFERVTAEGDTVGAGVIYDYPGVDGLLELARDAAGAPALGCPAATPSGSDISNSLSGRIGLVMRGSCPFIHKVANACRAGAVAVIVYNPPTQSPDFSINMSAPAGYAGDAVGIPAIMLPWRIARPLVRAVESGTEVDANIRWAFGEDCQGSHCPPPPAPLPCGNTVAAQPDTPAATDFTLRADGPNPARDAARLTLMVGTPQTVRVEAFSILGQRVALLHDGAASGSLVLMLDTSALASGVYLVRAVAGADQRSVRITVAR